MLKIDVIFGLHIGKWLIMRRSNKSIYFCMYLCRPLWTLEIIVTQSLWYPPLIARYGIYFYTLELFDLSPITKLLIFVLDIIIPNKLEFILEGIKKCFLSGPHQNYCKLTFTMSLLATFPPIFHTNKGFQKNKCDLFIVIFFL